MKKFDDVITSRQNRIVVEAVKLSEKKARENAKLFRFDGVKLFGEALEKGVVPKRILLCEGKADELISMLDKYADKLENTAISVLSDDVFSKVSEESSPEGLICIAEYPRKHVRNAAKTDFDAVSKDKSRRVLLLEAVRDPGNMGAIMRSAAAFGIDTLAVSRDCADIYNPKTVRGAMGALFKMNIFVFDDIREAVLSLRGADRNVYAAALDSTAVRLDEIKLVPQDVVIIGNEGHGLSSDTVNVCTQSLYIPMEDGSESLNAAIAASVILWNMYRG